MSRLPVLGGPADGHITGAASGTFRWITVDGHGHGQPGPGRHLYRYDGGAWRFAGHGARQCGGCGAILEARDGWPLDACPLCGARG